MPDVFIVLGNYLQNDGTLSLVNRERCFYAYNKLKDKDNYILLVSGGAANAIAKISEAQAMKDYFVQLGIKSECIVLEEKSKNTFENIKFCSEILQGIDYTNIVVVSSSYHIYRWYFNPIKFFKRYHGIKASYLFCFDSKINTYGDFDINKPSELIIYKNRKKLLSYIKDGDKNYFYIKHRAKQQLGGRKFKFFDSQSNCSELEYLLKNLYNITQLKTVRI